MIRVKSLRALLEKLPDDAQVEAYEGEGIGLRIHYWDEEPWWIETGTVPYPWNPYAEEETEIDGFERREVSDEENLPIHRL